MRKLFFALFASFCLLSAPAAEAVSIALDCHISRADALVFIPNHVEVGHGADYFGNRFELYLEKETGDFTLALTMVNNGSYCFMARGDNMVLRNVDAPENAVFIHDGDFGVFAHGSIPKTDFELEIHVERRPSRLFYIVIYDEKATQTLVIGLMWEEGPSDPLPSGQPIIYYL